MSATATLLRFRLRRDRVFIPVWAVVIALTCVGVAGTVSRTYGTTQLRVAALREFAGNPTLLALRGAPDGSSAGAFLWVEIGAYLALLVAIMNVLLAVRHVRADEEALRAELIVATQAGRASSFASACLLALAADAAVAVLAILATLADGLDPRGSLVLGVALGATGLAFFGVGLLVAQLFSTTRGATGCGVAIVGVAWLVAAAADATGTASRDGLSVQPSWPIWATPIGWLLRSRPFTADTLWPSALGVALGLATAGAAANLQLGRDTGAGLVPARRGPARGSALLRDPIGLAWRLQRGPLIGWGLGAMIAAGAIGGLGHTLLDAADSVALSGVIDRVAPAAGTLLARFLGLMMTLVGSLVAGAAIQTVLRFRQEEAAGTADAVLVTRVPRLRWFLATIVIAIAASAVALAASGLVAGIALADVESALVGEAFALAIAQLPAVCVFIAATALVFVVAPRATVPVGWTLFGLGIAIGEFGGLFGFPDWILQLAPTRHTPSAPIAQADLSGEWIMSAVAVALLVVAAWLFRRRDLISG